MKKYNKRGISLIVLVITIIVMIILAAAIILSISNSGIMDKANKAKQDSDTANLKEYANVLEAEWELMTPEERNGKTSVEYVNEELSKKYQNKTYSADGEIYADLSNIAKNAILKGLKIGDEVKYTVTTNKYTPDSSKTGCSNDKLTTQTDLKWIYIGVNDNGELLIAPDITLDAPKVTLKGKIGYLKGPDELNRLCKELYSVSGKGTARSMNIDDVIRILGYTGEKGSYYNIKGSYVPTTEPKTISAIASEIGYDMDKFASSVPESEKAIGDYYASYYNIDITNENSDYLSYGSGSYSYSYWLASPCVQVHFNYNNKALFCLFVVGLGSVFASSVYDSGDSVKVYGENFILRPVVSLTSNIQKSTENGSTVWSFVN